MSDLIRISPTTVQRVNSATGNPAIYELCYLNKANQPISDADVDGVNYIKYEFCFYQLSGGTSAFDGNRAITRISDLFGVNAGGTDVIAFLNNLFFPAIKPGAALSIDNPQLEVGSTTAYTLSWTATKQTNPITGITVDGVVKVPTGNTQSGTQTGNLGGSSGSFTKNMSVTAGADTVGASATRQYLFRIFWDTLAAVPVGSAAIRAVTNSALVGGGGSQTINTGTVNRMFGFWLPPGRTLISVIDQDALNLNITSLYIQTAATVNDASGTPQTDQQFIYTQATPYGTSHRHLVTYS